MKCPKFYNSLRKYGSNNFKWKILFETTCYDNILLAEFCFVRLMDTMNTGLNCVEGGNISSGMKGKHHSQKTKDKISKANKGKPNIKSTNVIYNITLPNNEIITTNNLNTFCKKYNLNYDSARVYAKRKKIYKGYLFVR